jgi:hypothetical protein
VRIGSIVGAMMVQTMRGHPSGGRILNAADSDDCKCVLEPQRTAETAVTKQPMITKVDPGSAEDVDPDHRKRDAGPAEEPWIEHQQRE